VWATWRSESPLLFSGKKANRSQFFGTGFCGSFSMENTMGKLTVEELIALIQVNMNGLTDLYYKDAVKRVKRVEHYAAILAEEIREAAQLEEDFKPSFLQPEGSSE
jgi:hypothetical protein